MSDKIECDGCGKTGARKLGAIAPKGWMYAEIHDNAETFYVYACSAECTRLEWKSGPGSLGLAETSASEAVAREHLGLKTLATRGSDLLDFHEHSVKAIRDALTAAYNAGKAAR